MADGLDALIKAENTRFVAEMRALSPNLANWAEIRLKEGFQLGEVQRVLKGMMAQAATLRGEVRHGR